MVDIQNKSESVGKATSTESQTYSRDRREYSPAIGLKEYWYPAIKDEKVNFYLDSYL